MHASNFSEALSVFAIFRAISHHCRRWPTTNRIRRQMLSEGYSATRMVLNMSKEIFHSKWHPTKMTEGRWTTWVFSGTLEETRNKFLLFSPLNQAGIPTLAYRLVCQFPDSDLAFSTPALVTLSFYPGQNLLVQPPSNGELKTVTIIVAQDERVDKNLAFYVVSGYNLPYVKFLLRADLKNESMKVSTAYLPYDAYTDRFL